MEDELKQAKAKALYLLNVMDRTEEQLRVKLLQKGFCEETVEQALEYVKSFGYINDNGYAERFSRGKQSTKSKKEIYAALCQKGLDKEKIEQAMEMCYEDYSETETIRKLVEKKHVSIIEATELEKKKIFDYLSRKGFRYEDIRQVIQVSSWNA